MDGKSGGASQQRLGVPTSQMILLVQITMTIIHSVILFKATTAKLLWLYVLLFLNKHTGC